MENGEVFVILMLLLFAAFVAVEVVGVVEKGANDIPCYEIQQLSADGAEVLRTWEGHVLHLIAPDGISFIDRETGLNVRLRNCPTIITEIKLDK